MATEREAANAPLPGAYSREHSVWMVGGGQGARPIVEVRRDLGETATFTKVQAEQDDTDIALAAVGDTATTTRVQAEADDSDITAATLDIATKTYAQVESEDVAFEIEAASGEDVGHGGITLPVQ
jgi:hypothetical protein